MADASTLILPTQKGRGPAKDRRVRWRSTVPALTILYHPDSRRVGERAVLESLRSGLDVGLSRKEPDFLPVGAEAADGRPRPLDDPYLSRKPLWLTPRRGGSVRLDAGGSPIDLAADGELVSATRELSSEEVERGVVLELGDRIVLLLHGVTAELSGELDEMGLVGESDAIIRLRQEIQLVADIDLPVLIRGETGTGKELAAQAIHRAGRLRDRPFVSLNMGAVPPSLAASELFGSSKGAFTGSVRSQMGYFHRAHSGSLFLDEIGETPPEVQVMLLRVLETGEIQKVGSQEPQKVDVRLIAATDADLERLIREGRFREPLLHRLAAYEIHIPPLRERRDDLGRLLFHFLRAELRQVGEVHRLDAPDTDEPWLPMSIVARLARHDWPGNIRQLRNVVRQLVFGSRGSARARVGPQVERLLREVVRRPQSAESETETSATEASEAPTAAFPAAGTAAREKRARPSTYRQPSEVGEEELIETLRAHRWQLKPTAAALGISRPSLYNLVEKSSRVRKVSDLSRAEILEAHHACDGDVDRMVDHLEVSKGGLVQRMKALDIG